MYYLTLIKLSKITLFFVMLPLETVKLSFYHPPEGAVHNLQRVMLLPLPSGVAAQLAQAFRQQSVGPLLW